MSRIKYDCDIATFENGETGTLEIKFQQNIKLFALKYAFDNIIHVFGTNQKENIPVNILIFCYKKKHIKYCIKNKLICLRNYFKYTKDWNSNITLYKIVFLWMLFRDDVYCPEKRYIYILKCIFKYYEIYLYTPNNSYERILPKDAKKMYNMTYDKYKEKINI